MKKWMLIIFFPVIAYSQNLESKAWIRINQLGYTPAGIKVAVYGAKGIPSIKKFYLIDASTKKIVFEGKPGNAFGAYGPFTQTYRLNFSNFNKKGKYYLTTDGAESPVFEIGDDVYKGAADFCLRYMRQQRSGFNPFLKDSCHTHDGYTLYGAKAGLPDSSFIDVSGGWHDASDYLQYATTSANATYHLLMAYRDFPKVFTDEKQANGLDGKNGMADVLDEAKWGLDWLLKMHPSPGIMFNQLGDDRDHMGMRIPKEDSFYGRGYERPVYFLNGEPQQRGKFMNATTGTSSTAGKFASVFALAQYLLNTDSAFKKNDKRGTYYDKAMSAYNFGKSKPGVAQTASVRSPYIYAEDNWTDDMELAAAAIHNMVNTNKGSGDNGFYLVAATDYAKQEKITPWLGSDTAKHYQWYPFINVGHYELLKELKKKKNGPANSAGYYKNFVDNFWKNSDTITGYYREGIQWVWNKAKLNAFYRAVPFIWCSNNLTVSFATQCYWYKKLTGDKTFDELEQANIDWIFGCNPWGTSMVYGLPSWGDTPVDPHSAFTHLKNYPIDGGLVDGPVYGSIYKGLIGIQLKDADEYQEFQSDLAVYHDDYGDYSSNEPTMDGTASLIYLLAAKEAETIGKSSHQEGAYRIPAKNNFTYSHGGIIRGDSTQKKIALVFTGDEFTDGGSFIAQTLKEEKVKASFFFTSRVYTTSANKSLVKNLINEGHFLGNHSYGHLLYCDWNKRDSLLVTKKEFINDLLGLDKTFAELKISSSANKYFLPPYEWYNDSITKWTEEKGRQLINFTPGTKSNADYTTPYMRNYRSSEEIYQSILNYEQTKPAGLNGFILLLHIGTDAKRTDKMYNRLPQLIQELKAKGYQFQRVDELLRAN